MSDLNRTENPVGRKDYRCEWCGQQIPKGERHAHYIGIWGGEWQDWRMHQECYEDACMDSDLDEGFMAYDHDRPKSAGAQPAKEGR